MCNFIETINLFYVATNIRDILVNTFKLESELAEKDRVSTFLIFFLKGYSSLQDELASSAGFSVASEH